MDSIRLLSRVSRGEVQDMMYGCSEEEPIYVLTGLHLRLVEARHVRSKFSAEAEAADPVTMPKSHV